MGADNNQGKGLFYLFLVVGGIALPIAFFATIFIYFPISDQAFPQSPPNNRLECEHGEQAYRKNWLIMFTGFIIPLFVWVFIVWCYRGYTAAEERVAKRIAEKSAQGWVVEEIRNSNPDADNIVFSREPTKPAADGVYYLTQPVVNQFGQPTGQYATTVETETVYSDSKISFGFLVFFLLAFIGCLVTTFVMAIRNEDIRKCQRNATRVPYQLAIPLIASFLWAMLGLGACFAHDKARVLEWVKNPDASVASFAYGVTSVHQNGYGTGSASIINSNGQNVGLTKHATTIWIPAPRVIQTTQTITTSVPQPPQAPQVQASATDNVPTAFTAQTIPGPQVPVAPTLNPSAPP